MLYKNIIKDFFLFLNLIIYINRIDIKIVNRLYLYQIRVLRIIINSIRAYKR